MSPSTPTGVCHHRAADAPVNLAVVFGSLSHDVRLRQLPTGAVVANLDVTTDTAPRDTVPVTMIDPPPAVTGLTSGDRVVVVGRVRRRFFRSGGRTQSRTEVVAERIARARAGRSRQAALALAERHLAALCATAATTAALPLADERRG